MRVFDVGDLTLKFVCHGHQNFVTCVQWVETAHVPTLVTGGEDCTV